MSERRRPVVVKFGGASLASPERVAELVGEARAGGGPVVVVASAREGVTDLLLASLRAPGSRSIHRAALASLRTLHPGLPPAGRLRLRLLARLFARLERVRHVDPPLSDRILSQGERLAVHWLAASLAARGIPAVPVEADHLGLITDNQYGASRILIRESEPAVRHGLRRILRTGRVPVVTGYFGRSLEGRVATLGRGGSDYAAAAVGAMIDAVRVDLVKRDVAIHSADPGEVVGTRPLPALSYEEAEELAQFGARVLHPLAIEPARERSVVLRVRSLEGPLRATTIGPARSRDHHRAITALRTLRLLRLRFPGGRQRPGIVADVSRTLAQGGVNLVQLFTSSALLCLLVEPRDVARAFRALRPMVRASEATLEGPIPVALVTAIGDGILGDLNRLPTAVVATAEGVSATPRSLALAVPEAGSRAALRSLHRALVGPER